MNPIKRIKKVASQCKMRCYSKQSVGRYNNKSMPFEVDLGRRAKKGYNTLSTKEKTEINKRLVKGEKETVIQELIK